MSIETKELSVPNALLELLVYGEKKNKEVIDANMNLIQDALSRSNIGTYCRILWYIDEGEKTDEEKKQWLIENSKCKYYIFVNVIDLEEFPNVKKITTAVRKFEKAYMELKRLDIVIKKK